MPWGRGKTHCRVHIPFSLYACKSSTYSKVPKSFQATFTSLLLPYPVIFISSVPLSHLSPLNSILTFVVLHDCLFLNVGVLSPQLDASTFEGRTLPPYFLQSDCDSAIRDAQLVLLSGHSKVWLIMFTPLKKFSTSQGN